VAAAIALAETYVDVVVRTLESLAEAIRLRGGRRRARPQVEAQLRRLRRR